MNIIMLLDNCFDPDVRVYKEAKYLVEQGNKVEIICLDKKNKYIDKETEELDGIKIKRIFCRTDKGTRFLEYNSLTKLFTPIVYLYWLLLFFVKTKRYIKNKSYEVLHCHDIVMAFGSSLFIKGKPIVFDMHEYYLTDSNIIKDFIFNVIIKYTQNKSKWIIYVNDVQIQNMHKKNKMKIIRLPNYPSQKIFKKIDKTKSEKLRISYIGAVRDNKSLEILMDAYERYNTIYDIKIYGYGSAFDELKQYEKTKKYSPSILMGRYNGVTEIEEIYQNTDILYCVYDNSNANWKYSFPVKFYEGIISKTPIIVSENSNVGEFVKKNDVGYTIDIENYSDIENLFNKLLIDREAYKRKKENTTLFIDNFVWEVQVKCLDKIYGRCDFDV